MAKDMTGLTVELLPCYWIAAWSRAFAASPTRRVYHRLCLARARVHEYTLAAPPDAIP